MVWLRLPSKPLQNQVRVSPHQSHRYAVKQMTVPQIERGIRMRKWGLNNPTQAIADAAGVNIKVINAILKGERVSDEAYALLTSYLRTPAGPFAVRHSRNKDQSKLRRSLNIKLGRLMKLGISRGMHHFRHKATLTTYTIPQLQAYFHFVDWRVKEDILINEPLAPLYSMPDELEAWEWLERFEQLRQRQKTSGSNQRLSISRSPSQPIDQTWRSQWELSRGLSTGSANGQSPKSATAGRATASTGSATSSPPRSGSVLPSSSSAKS
jgi:hypothetical protein